jgi:general stress protein 26
MISMNLKEKIFGVMGGLHVAALATVTKGRPAVRYMAMYGQDDLTLVGGTMKNSRKVEEMRKDPHVAISIWSCKKFEDPYVVILARGSIHQDTETKRKFWDPMMEGYFKNPENPDWVIVKFAPERIEYYSVEGEEVWEK